MRTKTFPAVLILILPALCLSGCSDPEPDVTVPFEPDVKDLPAKVCRTSGIFALLTISWSIWWPQSPF